MLKTGALISLAECSWPAADQRTGGSCRTPRASTAAQRPRAAAARTGALTRKPAPAGAMAYIIEPADGARVTSPVRVVFGLKGFGVAPAGVDRNDAGHHHLLVDAGMPANLAPADCRTTSSIAISAAARRRSSSTLPPGRHTLQMVVGDHLHIPHDPPIASSVVTIEVQ